MDQKEGTTEYISKYGFATTPERSRNMSRIKSKNTAPEVMLRKELWAAGFRFRKDFKELPGKPDIVFTKRRIAVFVDGSFWHGYKWNEKRERIKSNPDYWIKKISRNMTRDNEVNQTLRRDGWIVLRFRDKNVRKRLHDCIALVRRIYKIRE